jgi:D-alanyl-D-alanine dipeptidase/L,D-peptidoglycan transpeptidase YkuD (ErfK/YbiS/YcfS/YnhG family)
MKRQSILQVFLGLLLAGMVLAAPLYDGLVRVTDVDGSIAIDLRYATADNFTGRQVYPHAVAVLRQETALKLAAANSEFKASGYRLKLWDAYRPPAVQEIFWRLVPDERYVANPASGSRHSRGGAVDVTLVDAGGQEIIMPSAFDDFSGRAARQSPAATSGEAANNMAYLTTVMMRHGFRPIDSEWWHFEDSEAAGFPLADVGLEMFVDVPAALAKLEPGTKQALVVAAEPAGGYKTHLTAWEYDENGWRQAFDRLAAVIGRGGLAASGEKREGDGKTPAGIYSLGTAFGYGENFAGAMPYRQATADDYWVDDPLSPLYNQWVQGRPAARSFERMKRDDDCYKYGIVVEYNTRPVTAGLGSAIFVHVWRGPDEPTAGCVALAEGDLVRLLAWLDPGKRPVIILGGR